MRLWNFDFGIFMPPLSVELWGNQGGHPVVFYAATKVLSRRSVGWVNQTESKATCSKFHGEYSDNLFIFTTVATQCFVQQLQWHILLKV